VGRSSALIAGALLLAGCSGSTPSASPTCDEIACVGVLNGAAFEIVLPDEWNGTLLLYSHGYRSAQPTPPDFAPVVTAPEPAPRWASGDRTIGEQLLEQGYALAGSAYASNGWAVADGVRAGGELLEYFSETVAPPQRVYVWGESLGGLITAILAEERSDIDGALPICGVLAGVNPNMDLAVSVLSQLQQEVWPELPVTVPQTYEDALAVAIGASTVILRLAGLEDAIEIDISDFGVDTFADAGLDVTLLDVPDVEPNPELIRQIGASVDAPRVTRLFDGKTEESEVQALVEGLVTATSFGVLTRYELATRIGGDPVALGQVSDPAARAAAEQLGDARGFINQPTMTLHTAYDSVTIAQNVTWFADRVEAAGRATDLVTVFTTPPATFTTAPYGAGHCNFDSETLVGAVALLDEWVTTGTAPQDAAIGSRIAGFAPGYAPGPWPG
jgi:dienelactone hydrolase